MYVLRECFTIDWGHWESAKLKSEGSELIPIGSLLAVCEFGGEGDNFCSVIIYLVRRD